MHKNENKHCKICFLPWSGSMAFFLQGYSRFRWAHKNAAAALQETMWFPQLLAANIPFISRATRSPESRIQASLRVFYKTLNFCYSQPSKCVI